MQGNGSIAFWKVGGIIKGAPPYEWRWKLLLNSSSVTEFRVILKLVRIASSKDGSCWKPNATKNNFSANLKKIWILNRTQLRSTFSARTAIEVAQQERRYNRRSPDWRSQNRIDERISTAKQIPYRSYRQAGVGHKAHLFYSAGWYVGGRAI